MTTFNKQGGGGRFSSNRGGGKFGGGSARPSASKKSWGDDRQGDRPVTLHKATCAECSKTCEVPFRPMSGKPVYCKDCFAKREGDTRGNTRSDSRSGGYIKRDFDTRPTTKPHFESNNNDEVKKQLDAINIKLDRLTLAIENIVASKQGPVVVANEGLKEAVAAVTKIKKVAKRKPIKK